MSWLAAVVFLLSAVAVVYVLAGYPLLLALISRRVQNPVLRSPQQKTVSIILPVRNGEKWLRSKLASIRQLDYPRELVEIFVVSDGSQDGTEEIAREFAAEGVQLVSLSRSGKAAALNEGVRRAKGEILFFTDVRQPLAPDSLSSLVSCFADPSVGVASGELVILAGESQEEADVGLYWRYEKWIRKHQSRVDSVLGATGAIYAMRRELAVTLSPDTLLDDVCLPLGAFFGGYRIILDEDAKAYDYPTSLSTEFRRKVRTLAGVYQTVAYFPALLGPSNRMWIHFVSHKLGRLLLPYALLLLLITSFGLPGPWSALALAGQAFSYGMAAADLITPETWSFKRLTSPLRTFVVLMAAALCAGAILFSPAERFWGEAGTDATKPVS